MSRGLDTLRKRHALTPGDPGAAHAFAAALIRQGHFDEATTVLRAGLAGSLERSSNAMGERQPLLARLAMLPPAPTGQWKRLHRLSFPDVSGEISTACIVEPVWGSPEQALDADAEYRIYVGLKNGHILDVEASRGQLDNRIDTHRGRVLEIRSARCEGHRVVMSRGEGTAALWSLRAHSPSEGAHLHRRLDGVSAARFGTYRGKTVWLVGCVDGSLRWLDVSGSLGADLEVLDRAPWQPESHVIWDLAVDPERGALSVVHWMGLRVYRRFANNQQLDTTFELADQGGGSARLSSDGRRAVVVRQGRDDSGHRVSHYDLRAMKQTDVDLEMQVQGWRTDPELRFLAAWDVKGGVRLFDLDAGACCAEWDDCVGLREAWPDSHARCLWLVYPDRLEMMG